MKAPCSFSPSYIIVGLLLIYVSVLSAIVPWTGDDITYLYSFADGNNLSSLKDVFISQAAHWHIANGRFLAHFLVQAILVFVGRPGFVVMNALAYIALCIILLKLSDRKFSDWKSTLAVCVLILLAMPTKFVPTCQIGYVWMFDIALLFVLEWKRIAMERNASSKLSLLWLAPLAFLAGSSQEAIVVGLGASLCVYSIPRLKNLGFHGWIMLIAFGVGAGLLCFSPANFGRTSEVHSSFSGLGDSAVRAIKFFLYQRVSYLTVGYAVFLMVWKKRPASSVYGVSPFLWNAWVALILFNLVVGVFGNRQLFGAEIIAALLLLKLISEFDPPKSRLPECFVAVALLCLVSANTAAAFRSKNLYNDIIAGYEQSTDGSVSVKMGYFDKHYRESGPADAWSWYVTGTVDRLLHESGAPESKKLVIK